LVTLIGTNFVHYGTATLCKFGVANIPPFPIVEATVLSSSAALCVSPASSATTIAVEIAINGQDYSRDGILFEYKRMHSKHNGVH